MSTDLSRPLTRGAEAYTFWFRGRTTVDLQPGDPSTSPVLPPRETLPSYGNVLLRPLGTEGEGREVVPSNVFFWWQTFGPSTRSGQCPPRVWGSEVLTLFIYDESDPIRPYRWVRFCVSTSRGMLQVCKSLIWKEFFAQEYRSNLT